jgi:succinate-semialdehyde dehydrogenase/glutarate-semialdehyde dehydrogenase
MAVIDQPKHWGAVQDREQIEVKNPVTEEVIGRVPANTPEEVRQIVERVRAAQPAWEALGVKQRAHLLRKWGDLLFEDPQIVQAIRAETGKNTLGALQEVLVIENTVSYYTHHAPRLLRPQTRRATLPFVHKARLYYKPYGVAGFITPWNYPLLNAFQDLIPALIAGNTVVLKPSEVTPFVALYTVDLMYKAGIPKDVIRVVTGSGRTGAALVDHVDYISFTGSTPTGRKIAVRAAERLIPCSLELGGKDPLIILKDVDLDQAATIAIQGKLENAGQVCVSPERIYVESAIYDPFVERLLHHVRQLNISPEEGMDVHMGSLTNERELLRCEAQIADAVGKGATLALGGRRRPDLGPLFFEPTILVNVDHSMVVMREETFGPVFPVMRVADAEEAIRLANDSEYGLSGAIFTRDLKRGEQLATRIESGDVCVNRTHWIFGTPSLPMGGVKNSGMGRRNGPEGLMRFVKPQSIVVDNLLTARHSLTLLDPFTLKGALILRKLRRWLPFLRV